MTGGYGWSRKTTFMFRRFKLMTIVAPAIAVRLFIHPYANAMFVDEMTLYV